MVFTAGTSAVRVNQLSALAGLSAALLLTAAPAFAQSTATEEIETVTVTAEVKVQGEVLAKETIPKARGTITSEYIKTQPAGQTIFQSLNSVPGFNFTNSDPYGSSGGDVRIRGFDGNRIAFTWDGMPLNDTGNYAIFTNQVADPEILDRAQVNQGTTDVDSPTASAVGGTVDLVTKTPTDDFNILLQPSAGSFGYVRLFTMINTGEIGPWGTKAFFTASYQHYDKFKGPGTLNKLQFNGRIYQDLGDLGFVSVAAHFNANRNAFYRNLSYGPTPGAPPFSPLTNRFPQVFHDPTTDSLSGLDFDNDAGCQYGAAASQTKVNGGTDIRPTPGPGAQDEGTFAGSFTSVCTNYFGVRINPSDTGNVRGQGLFHITKSLSFTFDPSFQYVLANGGGISVFSDTDPRLIGNSGAAGVDLNKDGDVLDHVSLYTPSNTNTRRYGLTSSLIWQADDENVLQVGYTLDFGIHRQTGIRGYLDANGNPISKFGGLYKTAVAVQDADGSFLRGRDRKSYAILNQVAGSYESRWLDDMLRVDVGARLPFFQRDLNQFCFTQATAGKGAPAILTPGVNQPYCTTETPTFDGLAINGLPTATFAGIPFTPGPGNAPRFVVPFKGVVRYSKFLPNAGVSLSPWGDAHQFYLSFAEGISAPRTDDLYAIGIDRTVRPETTDAYDVGYRFLSDDHNISATIDGYNIKFKNRIVSSFDPVSGTFIDTNVGTVNELGVDASATIVPIEHLSLFSSVSYEHTRIERNLIVTNPATTCNNLPPPPPGGTGVLTSCTILTGGKELTETPDWQFFTRGQYTWEGLELGLQGKFVGRRFGTETNEAVSRVRDYFVTDADMSYDLGMIGFEGSSLRFNVTNVLNERYLGSIPTVQTCQDPTNALAVTPQNFKGSSPCGTPLASVGAPRAFQFTLDALLP